MHNTSFAYDGDIDNDAGNGSFVFSDFDDINDDENMENIRPNQNFLSPRGTQPQSGAKMSGFDAIPMQQNFGGNQVKFGLGSSNFDNDMFNDDIFDRRNDIGRSNSNNMTNSKPAKGFDAIPMGDSVAFGDIPDIPQPIHRGNRNSLFESAPKSQSNLSLNSNASSKRLIDGGFLKSLSAKSPTGSDNQKNGRGMFDPIPEGSDNFFDNPIPGPQTSMEFKPVSSGEMPSTSSIENIPMPQSNIARPQIDESPQNFRSPSIQINGLDEFDGNDISLQDIPLGGSISKLQQNSQNSQFNQNSQNSQQMNQASPSNNQISQQFNQNSQNSQQFKQASLSMNQLSQQSQQLNQNSPSNQQMNTVSPSINQFSSQNQQSVPTPAQNQQFIGMQSPIQPNQMNYQQQTMQVQNYQLPIEVSISAAFDRSVVNFKRMFSNDFSSIFRQSPSSLSSLDVDEFIDRLNSDVSSIIETPLTPVDVNTQNVTRKINAIIEEYTKPVTASLEEAESKNSYADSQQLIELKQLQEEIDNIRQVFKSSSDNVLRELDKERQIATQKRDAEMSKQMSIDERIRTLKLKRIELESKEKNQDIEKEGIQRSTKSLEKKKKKWEEETLPKLIDEKAEIKDRILKEVNSLKTKITPDVYSDLYNILNEGISIIKYEGEAIQNDLVEIDMSNRYLQSKTATNSSVYRSPKKAKKSSILDQTQDKLSRIKRQRASSVRDLYDDL